MSCRCNFGLLSLLFLQIITLTVSRWYNNGLIFYDLDTRHIFLPPTVSVSRGRSLANAPYSAKGSIWSTFGKPCQCSQTLCGCCAGVTVKRYNFDQKICANVTYAKGNDEIQLEMLLNENPSAKYGIAVRNPSPFCIPLMLNIPLAMCVQMSNIGVMGNNLNMCMDWMVGMGSTQLIEMHFQCMQVGQQGLQWVGTSGKPVIPPGQNKKQIKYSTESSEYYNESEENEIEIYHEEDASLSGGEIIDDTDLKETKIENNSNEMKSEKIANNWETDDTTVERFEMLTATDGQNESEMINSNASRLDGVELHHSNEKMITIIKPKITTTTILSTRKKATQPTLLVELIGNDSDNSSSNSSDYDNSDSTINKANNDVDRANDKGKEDESVDDGSDDDDDDSEDEDDSDSNESPAADECNSDGDSSNDDEYEDYEESTTKSTKSTKTISVKYYNNKNKLSK
ncbi:dentin sialophosphoprotein-like [Glossina fuscipes]|uniref:Dentin sialophosphoprotein-like n=1 Tax=Glossina fuscipes TaxID=7396 RepID=A0A9C5ZID9_9MUSC|nr:dentin sialophosphoprotein-like [Glossina fuscipes]KAI9590609.1 hypothetical protein GQX74_008776 [Glossina fuscipes]